MSNSVISRWKDPLMSQDTGGNTSVSDHGDEFDDLSDLPDLAPDDRIQPHAMGWWLLVWGVIGFIGSLALAIERFLSLTDPDHVPSCDISVFVTCGPAMESAQGSLLGFPNPIIGVAAFPVLITIGVFLILLRPALPKWFWGGLLVGSTLGMALVVILINTSLYSLRALCPYCMVVWAATIPLFWYALVYARQEGVLGSGGGTRSWIVRNRVVILVGLYAVLVLWVFAVLGNRIIDSF